MRFSSSRSSRAQLGVERGQRLVHQIDRRASAPARGRWRRAASRRPTAAWRGSAASARCAAARRRARRACRIGRLGHAPRRRAQREGQVVEHAEVRIERILLEHEGDVALRRRQRRRRRGRRWRCGRDPASPGRRSGAASWSCRRRSGRAARRTRRRRWSRSMPVDGGRRRRSACSTCSRRTSAMGRPLVQRGADGAAALLVEQRQPARGRGAGRHSRRLHLAGRRCAPSPGRTRC